MNEEFLAKKISDAIQNVDSTKPESYDAPAEVLRIENQTAWVHIDGGVAETPVKLTINAKVGDTVQVRVTNGHAFIIGNVTAPPTDDSKAEEAIDYARIANNAANEAVTSAHKANEAAQNAQADAARASSAASTAETNAQTAITNAGLAQTAADSAQASANNALLGLSQVESVVDTLNWLTEHSKVTEDTTPDPDKNYYIKNQDNTFTLVTDTTGKNPAQEGWYEMDDAISNYVASHLALTDEGLYILSDSNGYKYLIKSNGAYILDENNNVLSSYTAEGIRIGRTSVGQTLVDADGIEFISPQNIKVGEISSSGTTVVSEVRPENKDVSILDNIPEGTVSHEYLLTEETFNLSDIYISANYSLYAGINISNIAASRSKFGNRIYRFVKSDGTPLDDTCFLSGVLTSLNTNTSDEYSYDIYVYKFSQSSYVDFGTIKVYANFELSSSKTLKISLYLDLSQVDWSAYRIIQHFGCYYNCSIWHQYYINDGYAPEYLFGKKISNNPAGAYGFQAGEDVYAQGANSVAIGKGVETYSGSGIVGATDIALGYFNDFNSIIQRALFVLGNGTDANNRSNAFIVYYNGDVKSSGEITDGTNNVLSEKLDASLLADYVIEQGTSGNWRYRKWNSGKIEAWAKITFTYGATTAVGQLHRASISTTFPTALGLSANANVLATMGAAQSIVTVNMSVASSGSGLTGYIFRPTSQSGSSTVAISLYVWED